MKRRIPEAQNQFTPKPFIDDGTLKLVTVEKEGRIEEFVVTYKGTTKNFPVKKFNILEAWKQVEKFLADLK